MRLLPLLVALALSAAAQTVGVYSTVVAPAKGETFQGPCRFEVAIPAREIATRAVWVVFDRGLETRSFYDDEAVFRFAEQHRLALLWARHCPSAETGDIDPQPSHGLGRALFTALDQLARASAHGEFSTSKLIMLGYSEAALLAASMPAFAPDRVLASIAYAPIGLEPLTLEHPAAGIPQLVIANGADPAVGTQTPFRYFERHFTNGAPWAFAIQNGAAHEGGLSAAKSLMFSWIEMVLEATPDTTSPVALSAVQRTGWWLYLQKQEGGTKDDSGAPIARAKDAKIGKVGQPAPSAFAPAGWVASRKAAAEWQSFVRKQSHVSDAKY